MKVFFKSSMLKKLLLSFLLVAIVPFVLFTLISMLQYYSFISNQLLQQRNDLLNNVAHNIETQLINNIVSIVNAADNSERVNDYLISPEEDSNDLLFQKHNIETELRQYSTRYGALNSSILLLPSNADNLTVDSLTTCNATYDTLSDYSWFTGVVENPYVIHWLNSDDNFYDTGRFVNVIAAAKLIQNQSTGKPLGLLYIQVPEHTLQNLYSTLQGDDGTVHLISGSGDVLSTTSRSDAELAAFTASLEDSSQEPIRFYKFDNTTQVVMQTSVPKTDWTLYYTIPEGALYRPVNDMLSNSVMFITAIVVCVILVAYRLSFTISAPFMELKKRIDSRHLSKVEPIGNEVTTISHEYENMLSSLENTIETLVETQKNMRISELKALQMQIRPHFIYNTLQSIQLLASTGKHDKIEPTIAHFIELLRATVSIDDTYITLNQEVKLLQNYIYLFEIRNDKRYELQTIISEEVKNFLLPKLLLQPIVENSLQYAFIGRTDAVVTLNAYSFKDTVIIEIADNGVGVDKQTLINIAAQSNISEPSDKGIGIGNIRARLLLLYGAQASLTVESTQDIGTTVTVVIPKNNSLKDTHNVKNTDS